MFRFLKRLWRDRRGNAILIAGAALPMLVGAAGLATDSIQWVLWKRELQRAADSAALAGVYAKAENIESVSTAVTADLAQNNNHTGVSLLTGYPAITFPTSSVWTNGVAVELRIQKRLGFSSLFLSAAPTIKASATAAMVPSLNACAWALNKTTNPSVTIGGSSNTNLGCPVISDSTGCPAVAVNGTSYNFTADKVAAVGCLPSSINGVTSLMPHYLSQADPFAGQFSTDVPSGMTCSTHLPTNNNNNHVTPGCYTNSGNGNNNPFHLTGSVVLDPGVYYLNNIDFDTTGGATVTGNNVTIILTGTTPGSIQTNGNSTVQLSAPSATGCGIVAEGGVNVNTCDYKNMLIIQSANATTDNANVINGNNTSSFDGAIYMPKGQISFSGSSADSTKCLMVVGNTLNFTGNTNLQNNTTGCNNAIKKSGKEVRLIA